jgi:HD-like signal output (HDOD) protein
MSAKICLSKAFSQAASAVILCSLSTLVGRFRQETWKFWHVLCVGSACIRGPRLCGRFKAKPGSSGPNGIMGNHVTGKSLRESILRDVDNLPPMPRIMHKARQVLDDPRSSLKDLASLIETDQAIAMKVLRLSNSAYYSRLQKVSSIQEAAVVLGLKVLGEMLTVACSAKLLGRSLKGYKISADAMWRHCLSVAVGSRIVANKRHPAVANEAFSAGLIHDAGKLILDRYVLEREEAFSGFLADGNETFLSAEKSILGFDHAEIAARVCEKWNFPKSISVGIKYHHSPSRFRGNELGYIVHVSDQIAVWSGMATDGISLEIGDRGFDVLGITVEEIGPIMDEVVCSVNQIAENIEV